MCVTLEEAIHAFRWEVKRGCDKSRVHRTNLGMLTADLDVGAAKLADNYFISTPFVFGVKTSSPSISISRGRRSSSVKP